MVNFLRNFYNSEKASMYSLLGTGIRLIFAPVSLLLISSKLTEVQQGYYYLFFAISGMQQVFEAGFSHTLVQGIAHEMKDVFFDKRGLHGNERAISKVRQNLLLGISWYSLLSLISFFGIGLIGFYVLIDKEQILDLSIILPWFLFIAVFSVNLFLFPVAFFLEGIQEITKIYKFRLFAQIISTVSFCVFLYLDFGLYVTISGSLASFIVNLLFIYLPHRDFFNEHLFKMPERSFVKERFRWQLKVGFVWSSGYLYWQLPTIIIFKLLDPIIAGKYGLTINIINSIINIGQVFITTKASIIGKLRAMGEEFKALSLFYQARKISFVVIVVGFVLFFVIWLTIPEYKLFTRVFSFSRFLTFVLIYSLAVPVTFWSFYARCSTEEPYFYLSTFVNFFFPLLLIILLSIYKTVDSILLTFFIVFLIQFFWGYKIFKKVNRRFFMTK